VATHYPLPTTHYANMLATALTQPIRTGYSLQRISGQSGHEWTCRWRFRRRDEDVVATAEGSLRRSPAAARVEAALFVADGPLSPRKLVQYALLPGSQDALAAIDELNAAYDEGGSPFRVEQVAAGFRLLTRPIYARWLDRVHARHARLKLSSPALETLALVAYRQPVTRADIDAIRGVQSTEMLRQLMERGLVKIVGEDDSLGRPYLYGTTREFLENFGLHRLDDLPNHEALRPPEPEDALEEEDELLEDSAADMDETDQAAA